MLNVFRHLHTKTSCFFLLAISLVFLALRLPSLVEPYWYGDEGIYQVIGSALNNGRVLYVEVWDNKPPLLYYIYGLLKADQFYVRLTSLLFGIFSVITFFALSRELFSRKKAVFISTGLFALLFALPLTEANIANAENFMLLPILISALFIFRVGESFEKNGPSLKLRTPLFIAGLLLGLAFLIKIVAIFDAASFLIFLFFVISLKKSSLKSKINLFIPYFLGFGVPIAFSIFFLMIQGAAGEYMKAAFLSNVDYVGYGNKLFIPQGLLLLKILVLIIYILLLYRLRKRLHLNFLFIVLWLGFSLFDTFFSQRPYTHYVLMSIASLALILGAIFAFQKERILALVLFLTSTYLLITVFKLHTNPTTIPYYINYLQFISGGKNLTAYQSFFDKNTPRDYDIASYLKPKVKNNEQIFIWGNSAQIYRLSDTLPAGRYTVSYHIGQNQLEETRKAITQIKPKFFVVLPDRELPTLPLGDYTYRVTIQDTNIYERTY